MAKLQDDPKIQALIAKSAGKAAKDATKTSLNIIKDALATAKQSELDKTVVKALSDFAKTVSVSIKSASTAAA